MRKVRHFLFVFLLMNIALHTNAQLGSTIELKKPEKYENRTLGSEKTTDKKLGRGKRLFQNTVTHYNYFFNADTRLNEIVVRAKQGFKDDFTKLLPYYNYTLDLTSTDADIDSVIYKCNAGILLHDLRNDWVDDLYFLMGKAYYLRKNFDSAEQVFLYINYAFAPKEDGYDVPIGSNVNNTTFTVATKEKKGLSEKLSNPPRRNEDLIWVAKNFIDAGKPYEASGILEILRHDQNFPERLQPQLHETIGYLFYKEKIYDSAAFHLSKATDLDDNKQEKARREFLTAQLYASSGSNEEAEKYFNRSAEHTTDPIMAVYASLNAIIASGDSLNTIDKKIISLLHLAQKDRYLNYRDIIYYAAAEAEIDRKNYVDANKYLKKSIKYSIDNPIQKSRSFMLLGDIEYIKPDYKAAGNYYDSVDMSSLATAADQQRLTERLGALQTIAANINIIHTEDSLQHVAHLPEGERTALIKKTVRQLRKAQGLKDEDLETFVNPAVQAGNDASSPGANLFGSAAAKGDWYFNNDALRVSGFSSFRSSWGNRPNVDNWQRQDAVNKQIAQVSANANDDEGDSTVDNRVNHKPSPQGIFLPQQNKNDLNGEISYDALLANLPLTDDQLSTSNDKIADALFSSAQQFQNQIQDYYAAIEAYETLNRRFPQNLHLEETLFGLYYCYNKTGKKSSADSALSVLNTKFKEGKWAKLLNNPVNKKTEPQAEDAATKEYENIYDLFIQGSFEQAKVAKAKADSVYGSSYWTPQLLYIESIYYVSKREDIIAIQKLTAISGKFGNSPLAQKAQNMIDVLKRRNEIETYLTNLQITRLPDDEPSPVVDLNPVENVIDKKEIKKDSIVTKKANQVANPNVDTLKTISGTVRTYVFNASDRQFVAILLNKVDPVYANETRNAFNRYNQINLYNQKINVASSKVNDTLNVVLLGPFSDAAAALIYVNKVKPKTQGTIIPWLKPDKYSFTIISQANLDILNDTKDLQGYKSLIENVLPGKF